MKLAPSDWALRYFRGRPVFFFMMAKTSAAMIRKKMIWRGVNLSRFWISRFG